jgi:hypothetical protein
VVSAWTPVGGRQNGRKNKIVGKKKRNAPSTDNKLRNIYK